MPRVWQKRAIQQPNVPTGKVHDVRTPRQIRGIQTMIDTQKLIYGLDGFIQCPRCGSGEATLSVKPMGTNPPRRQFRGHCPDCGRNTGWVQL